MAEKIKISQGGGNSGRAKLTWKQVDKIRSLAGRMTQRKIAERFGVNQKTVSDIIRGEIWKPETRNAKTKAQVAADLVRQYPHLSHIKLARLLCIYHAEIFGPI